MDVIKNLKYFAGGKWLSSDTHEYMDIYNPSTGEIIARLPRCTADEVESTVHAAQMAYNNWSNTPARKRVQVLYNLRELIQKNLDDLTYTLSKENGKTWEEAQGDVLKAKEIIEFACGIPSLMMGEFTMNSSPGFDTVLYREPLGVFLGIVPFNFPQ